MASLRPIRKVQAGATGGGAAALVIGLLDTVGVELPDWGAAIIGVIVTAGLAYLTSSAPGEATPRRLQRPPDVRLP